LKENRPQQSEDEDRSHQTKATEKIHLVFVQSALEKNKRFYSCCQVLSWICGFYFVALLSEEEVVAASSSSLVGTTEQIILSKSKQQHERTNNFKQTTTTTTNMGRVPPHEYTDAPRGGFNQIMEKLPHGGQPDTIAISNSDPNDNIELAVNPDKQRLQELEELEYMMAARNAKSYFVFASCLALLGLAFSITSMVSCSFGVVNWAVDGDTSAYQADVTHLGLFRWYNHKTSSCWAYNPLDTDFFYVDKAARGLAAAAVVFGGCAAWIVVIIFVANYLACCVKRGCCSRFNLNSTSNSTTFFSLSGLTFLASLLQICTLTYFNQGNVPSWVVEWWKVRTRRNHLVRLLLVVVVVVLPLLLLRRRRKRRRIIRFHHLLRRFLLIKWGDRSKKKIWEVLIQVVFHRRHHRLSLFLILKMRVCSLCRQWMTRDEGVEVMRLCFAEG